MNKLVALLLATSFALASFTTMAADVESAAAAAEAPKPATHKHKHHHHSKKVMKEEKKTEETK